MRPLSLCLLNGDELAVAKADRRFRPSGRYISESINLILVGPNGVLTSPVSALSHARQHLWHRDSRMLEPPEHHFLITLSRRSPFGVEPSLDSFQYLVRIPPPPLCISVRNMPCQIDE
jgi:hypothetical protein